MLLLLLHPRSQIPVYASASIQLGAAASRTVGVGLAASLNLNARYLPTYQLRAALQLGKHLSVVPTTRLAAPLTLRAVPKVAVTFSPFRANLRLGARPGISPRLSIAPHGIVLGAIAHISTSVSVNVPARQAITFVADIARTLVFTSEAPRSIIFVADAPRALVFIAEVES